MELLLEANSGKELKFKMVITFTEKGMRHLCHYVNV